ncbi:alpha/beta hydrolase [Chitinophaga sp. Mgbs1]|uniref:Alpha/beta hydrolase n=1 Tax=Chitinophaga solisilvae TaxID=1233460 RepID=A0A3S1AXF9_9BACT|nr:alpha/beta hydrolase [Chitinophaga solisilvae]
MRNRILWLLCLSLLPTWLSAQKTIETGRKIIRDLGRIVNPNGIQENYTVNINGVDQWLYARGQNKDNPVILFIHGGPASPLSPVMWTFQRPLEEYYTIVTYDQRGAGRTFLNIPPDSIAASIRIDTFVDDAIEVASYIRQRYHAKKIILMGHSWGTILGMKAALKRPDLFAAYIGVGQVINVMENERVSFDYAVEQATRHKNDSALAELKSIAPYPGNEPITRHRIIIARNWAQYYGGLSAYRSESMYFYNAPWLSPEYDANDIPAIDNGNIFTLWRILPEFLQVDFKKVHTFPIPVFMFLGRHDYTTPAEPTAAWMKQVKAPVKKAVWFEHSSHLIPMEEPGKMLISLKECLDPVIRGK